MVGRAHWHAPGGGDGYIHRFTQMDVDLGGRPFDNLRANGSGSPSTPAPLDTPFSLTLALSHKGRGDSEPSSACRYVLNKQSVFHGEVAVGQAGDVAIVCYDDKRGPGLTPEVEQGLQHGLPDG